jgi:hypothetical protein
MTCIGYGSVHFVIFEIEISACYVITEWTCWVVRTFRCWVHPTRRPTSSCEHSYSSTVLLLDFLLRCSERILAVSVHMRDTKVQLSC